MATKKEQRRLRIKRSIRKKVTGTQSRPRLSVFRSNKCIYAQIIDDVDGKTLANASSLEVEGSKNNVESANAVGKLLAEKASANGVSSVIFDRNGYLYHGRIKALAEGAREGGLKF